MDDECISTYNIRSLHEYYQARCPQPRLWWHNAVDLVALEAEVGPVTLKISKFHEFLRGLTENVRYRQAAWCWLFPHNPCYGITHLSSIQQRARLDHVERLAFLRRLNDFCLEVQHGHEKLGRWIAMRQALLDYELSPPKSLSQHLRDTERDLRFSLVIAMNLLWQQQDLIAAAKEARGIAQAALEAGASAACDVLGKGNCRFSANLMVPAFIADEKGPGYSPNSTARDNAEKAQDLWSHCRLEDRCLVIVEETKGGNHIGFWLPLIRGDDDSDLPGASSAYFQMEANGVFKDDLPPLKGFSRHLADHWHAYIRKALNEKMFVSIPLAVTDPQTGGKKVIAVMNVNADPHLHDGWRRAYHREWLLAAQSAAEDFIEVAYLALLIRMAAEGNQGNPRLQTGISAWDSIPGTSASNTLPMGE